MVLDSSGFVRRSKMFPGNVAEGSTLQDMLKGLDAPKGALVIMDAGIATEANLAWLKEQGYRYLAVSRERTRQFDPDQATEVLTASHETVHCNASWTRMAPRSGSIATPPDAETKETAISARFVKPFEAGLTKLAEGLAKPAHPEDHRGHPAAHRAAEGEEPRDRPALRDHRHPR